MIVKKIMFVLFSVICMGVVSARHLPSFLTPCHRVDLSECAIKQSKTVIQHLQEGYKPFHIPPLNPLRVQYVELEASENLKAKFRDVEAFGLDTGNLSDLQVDLDKHHVYLRVHFDKLKLSGEYEITGRILILPITGKGPGELIFDEPDFELSFDYDLIKHNNGKTHIKIKTRNLKFTIKRAHFKLDNLFNGDPRLGPEMNRFLNENWEEVSKEISPVMSESIKSLVFNVFDSLADLVPYDEIFLDG